MKTKTAISIIIIFIILSQTFSQWIRTGGPEGITVHSLLSISDTVYAGTITDGVYASATDGVNWFPLNTGIERKQIEALATKPGHLFAGTSGDGVYRTTNNGQTWLAPVNASNLDVSSIVLKDSYVFAGSNNDGIYRSSDNGTTWHPSLPGSLLSIFAMCISGNKIYASSYGSTYISTDNGTSWNEEFQLTGAFIFSFYSSGSLIIGGAVNEIYRSTDQGNTFTQIPIPNPNSYPIVVNSIVAINSILYMATSLDGVYKSTDNGSTWSPSNEGMGPKDVRALTVTGSSNLVAGTHYVGVFRSTDNGANWNKSMAGFHAGSTIASMISVGSTIYAGTRGDGVYRTTDNGASWIKLSGNNDTINYSLVRGMCEKNGVIYAGTQLYFTSTVYKSSDEGITWNRSGSGIPGTIRTVYGMAASGNNLLAATDKGLYYSANDGVNWLRSDLPATIVSGVATGGNDIVYSSVGAFGVGKSVNNGVNWTQSLVSSASLINVSAKDNYAYVGSFDQGLRYTSNFGSTWGPSAGFQSNTTIFASQPVSGGLVLAATDIMPNWIYASTNFGVSFTPFSEGLAQITPVEAFAVNDSFMFAGTDFNGVWRRLRPELVIGVATHQNKLPRDFRLYQNYPNPFNPQTLISYSIPRQEFVNLKVYDMMGREVKILVNEIKRAGHFEVVFNGEDYASGIYFYRITAGNFTAGRKMILVK